MKSLPSLREREITGHRLSRGNADPVEYKLATAFEALIGALYLSGETDRIEEIIGEALNIIESDLKVKKIKPGASYSRHTKEKESKNE